ncbi:MAG TPA: DinB family protein [Vicinamibacterales bacterium]|nr:DinB family protein [Vicinamibacterales bacterium]
MNTFSLTSVRASLLQAPRIVEGLIASAPKDVLTWREGGGAWNCVEVLCHLADGEITHWIPRVELILDGGGRFTPFEREGGFTRYAGWSAEPLVGEFGQLRRANVETIDRLALTPVHLKLRGEHPEFGPVTLEQLLACWATHDFAHIAQISRILTRAVGAHVGPWRKYFSLLQGTDA